MARKTKVALATALTTMLVAVAVFAFMAAPAFANVNNSYNITYSGQGLYQTGTGGYGVITEICGTANGADVDGTYLLWVLTATKATSATITFPWGTFNMTPSGGGAFKYIEQPWPSVSLSSLIGTVYATYSGTKTNAQFVISHGCAPHTQGAWCSPGYWKTATDAAWALTGVSKSDLFNGTVVPSFYGTSLLPDNPTLNIVLNTSGGTYKGPGVAGTDPRTQPPNAALNPFNATGAYLTDHIPGYSFDPTLVPAPGSPDDETSCPIDHFGNFK